MSLRLVHTILLLISFHSLLTDAHVLRANADVPKVVSGPGRIVSVSKPLTTGGIYDHPTSRDEENKEINNLLYAIYHKYYKDGQQPSPSQQQQQQQKQQQERIAAQQKKSKEEPTKRAVALKELENTIDKLIASLSDEKSASKLQTKDINKGINDISKFLGTITNGEDTRIQQEQQQQQQQQPQQQPQQQQERQLQEREVSVMTKEKPMDVMEKELADLSTGNSGHAKIRKEDASYKRFRARFHKLIHSNRTNIVDDFLPNVKDDVPATPTSSRDAIGQDGPTASGGEDKVMPSVSKHITKTDDQVVRLPSYGDLGAASVVQKTIKTSDQVVRLPSYGDLITTAVGKHGSASERDATKLKVSDIVKSLVKLYNFLSNHQVFVFDARQSIVNTIESYHYNRKIDVNYTAAFVKLDEVKTILVGLFNRVNGGGKDFVYNKNTHRLVKPQDDLDMLENIVNTLKRKRMITKRSIKNIGKSDSEEELKKRLFDLVQDIVKAKRHVLIPAAPHNGVQPWIGKRQVLSPIGKKRSNDVPVITTPGKRQWSTNVGKKQVIVPIGKKQVADPVAKKQVIVPIGKKQVVIPISKKQILSPIGKKERVGSIDKKKVVDPIDKKQVLVPMGKKQVINPISKKQVLVPFGVKDADGESISSPIGRRIVGPIDAAAATLAGAVERVPLIGKKEAYSRVLFGDLVKRLVRLYNFLSDRQVFVFDGATSKVNSVESFHSEGRTDVNQTATFSKLEEVKSILVGIFNKVNGGGNDFTYDKNSHRLVKPQDDLEILEDIVATLKRKRSEKNTSMKNPVDDEKELKKRFFHILREVVQGAQLHDSEHVIPPSIVRHVDQGGLLHDSEHVIPPSMLQVQDKKQLQRKQVLPPASKKQIMPPLLKRQVLPPLKKRQLLPPLKKKQVLPPLRKKQILLPVKNLSMDPVENEGHSVDGESGTKSGLRSDKSLDKSQTAEALKKHLMDVIQDIVNAKE